MTTTHDIDLNPQTPKLRGQRLPELADLYLADISRRNQAKTINGYRLKLRYFMTWWEDAGPAYNYEIGADQLAEFGRWLERQPISYNTRKDALRRLAQMLKWGFRRKAIPFDLSLDVPAATGSPPAKMPIELETLSRLMAATERTEDPTRNAAIIAILAGTGARCEEAAAIRIEQITIYADGAGQIRLTVTKNDKERIVAFDAATGQHLRRWLDEQGTQAGPLFPSRTGGRGRPLTPSGLYKIVAELAQLAGVREQVRGPHDLRRMFATVWSRRMKGESYGQLLQQQLGHASWATTQLYSLQNSADVLQAMRSAAASPLAMLAEMAR